MLVKCNSLAVQYTSLLQYTVYSASSNKGSMELILYSDTVTQWLPESKGYSTFTLKGVKGEPESLNGLLTVLEV